MTQNDKNWAKNVVKNLKPLEVDYSSLSLSDLHGQVKAVGARVICNDFFRGEVEIWQAEADRLNDIEEDEPEEDLHLSKQFAYDQVIDGKGNNLKEILSDFSYQIITRKMANFSDNKEAHKSMVRVLTAVLISCEEEQEQQKAQENGGDVDKAIMQSFKNFSKKTAPDSRYSIVAEKAISEMEELLVDRLSSVGMLGGGKPR